MRVSDIVRKYQLDALAFDRFLVNHPQIQTSGFFDKNILDSEVPQVVELFRQEYQAEQDEVARQAQDAAIKQQAIASILVTSGFNFDGYTITKYSGYISGDDAIQINRSELFNKKGQLLTDSLSLIRIQALKELKEAAYDLGCNAVIGVDFDYLTFEPETIGAGGTHYYEPYVVCVTANGNAVVIEKD